MSWTNRRRNALWIMWTLAMVGGLAPGLAAAGAPAAWTGSGMVPPGATIEMREPIDSGSIDVRILHEIGSEVQGGSSVTVLREEKFGVGLERVDGYYSRGDDGDIFLHGVSDHLTGRSRWYEPPLLLVDLPLEVGKQWRSRGHRREGDDSHGPLTPYDHVSTVTASDTTSLADGFVEAFLVSTEGGGEDVMTNLWYAPGMGIIARQPAGDAPMQMRTNTSAQGPRGLGWTGRDAHLSFAWPSDSRLRVRKAFFENVTDPARADTTAFSYELSIEPAGAGRRIRHLLAPSGADPDTAAHSGALQRILALQAPFTVDAAGSFVGLDDAAGVRDSVLAATGALWRQRMTPTEAAHLDSVLRATFTPEAMTASAAAEWKFLAGQWLAIADTTGNMVEFEAMAPLELYGGASVRTRGLAATAGFGRCSDETGNSCVVVCMSQWFEDPVMPLLVRQWIDQNSLDPIAAGEPIEAMTLRIDTAAFLDPQTALPLFAVRRKRLTIEAAPEPYVDESFEYREYTLSDGP